MISHQKQWNRQQPDTLTPPTQMNTLNRSILKSLQEGGYILYVRHAEATLGYDFPNLNFWDCSTQRNLSQNGRMQAARYGYELRRLQIPIMYPVLTSPFCRNRETAVLAFGVNYFQVDPFLVEIYNLSTAITPTQHSSTLNSLRTFLETPPPIGANKIIIGHSFPEGVGLGQIPDMGTVIIRPYGQGRGYHVVGQLTIEELTSL